MTRSFIALIALVALSMCAFGHGHSLALEKDVELEMADAFHGLGHFEFLEEHEEPSTAASKREDAAPKPSPKRLQCSCTFKKANMQPVAKGNSFIEESNRYKNSFRGFPSRTYYNLRRNN